MSEVNPVAAQTSAHVPAAAAPVSQESAAASQGLPQMKVEAATSVVGGTASGCVKRLHGFSVAEPAAVDTSVSEAATLAALAATPKKAGKLVSLPGSGEAMDAGAAQRNSDKLRAGGMRVVLPEQAGVAVSTPAAPQLPAVQQGTSPNTPVPVPSVPAFPERSAAAQTVQGVCGSPMVAPTAAPAAETAAAAPPPPPPPPPAATPVTPGKVVEPGQEHTGRWTKEEHEAFLTALQMYGKEWKKVAARVKTRTVVQTRTHAQKYFQKLQKVMKTSGDGVSEVGTVEMGTASSAKKASPASAQKKKEVVRRKSGGMAIPTSALSQQRQPSAAAQAAAQLMAQMATSQPHAPSPAPAAATQQLGVTTSSSSYITGAAQPQGEYSSSQIFTAATAASDSQLPTPASETYSTDQYAGSAAYGTTVAATHTRTMKIVAPPPDQSMKRGFFPEPSPAACGKRKLAEIAAAQMLAGVAAASGGSAALAPPPPPPPPPPPLAPPAVKGYIDSMSGQATPPPQDGGTSVNVAVAQPAPKPAAANGGGLSLQIVNPDVLEDSGGKRRRVLNGQASPSTPWDGELEALVSEVKSKGTEPDVQGIGAADKDVGSPGLLGMAFDEEGTVAPPRHPLQDNSARSDLHKAVCTQSIEAVAAALSISNAEALLNQCDSDGFFPLHSAAAIGIAEGNPTPESIKNAEEIVHLLLSSGGDACCCDSKGNTPLHWAARAGSPNVAHTLIMRNCPLDAPNESGETALHWAMRAGLKGLDAVRVLLTDGSRASAFNNDFRRPLDVAAEGFAHLEAGKSGRQDAAMADGVISGAKGATLDKSSDTAAAKELEIAFAKERRRARANFFFHSPQSRTLVLNHPDCLDHIPKSAHDWECPDRVQCILDRISKETTQGETDFGIQPHEIVISSDFDRAPLELLSRIHSATYLAFVNDLSKELESRRKRQLVETTESTEGGHPSVVPFTPMVQRTILNKMTVKKGTHSDTSFSAGSLKAARRAAGAVQHAVDRVLIGRNRNAFCVVRPPGHHAGVNGLLAGGESCGFCIFNSVAAGAMHALSDESHRPRCERCAIVDIDVHHGNGTEEIVRKCHDPGRLLFFSVHLYDQERRRQKGSEGYKFYPGTGDKDDVAHNIINVPIAPLWRERGVIKSATGLSSTPSATPVESRHNTRFKKRRQEAAAAAAATSKSASPLDSVVDSSSEAGDRTPSMLKEISDAESMDDNSSRASSSRGSGGQKGNSPQPSHYQMGVGRLAYRRAIQQRLLPALRAFNPDLILLSTGFDASRGDVGNARHYAGGRERMGLDLEPEDYAWSTRKIIEIADICCHGRVVSVLEGGYGRTPVVDHASLGSSGGLRHHLDRTAFAECAIQHLRALIDSAHVVGQNSSTDS